MVPEFSMKEFYDVVLKANYPMTIKGRSIEVGEVIASFDRIEIANFNEIKQIARANGGYDNRTLITWESTKELNLTFAQGIFNKEQLSLMINANLVNNGSNTVNIHQREEVEINADGDIIIKHQPLINTSNKLYVYKKSDGTKVTISANPTCTQLADQRWKVEIEGIPYTDVIVDYHFQYTGGEKLEIGKQLYEYYVTLEGRTKVQEDISGNFKTAIIKIPKLKIMSELSIRLGKQAQPIVGTFKAIGLPVGDRGHEEVMELLFLEDDIDSDM